MLRKGNCLDKAAMESFFGMFKSEFFYLNKFRNLDELQVGIKETSTITTTIESS
jgi:transposase InsO family protein